MINIIAAVGKNLELGIDNHLLWNLPSDMKSLCTFLHPHYARGCAFAYTSLILLFTSLEYTCVDEMSA